MRRGRHSTEEQHKRFLATLETGASVGAAAEAAGVVRTAAYRWREDADFAVLWDDAYERGTDVLEDEAKRRAVDGVPEPVGWFQGVAGGTVQKYSDALLIFSLKARRRAKYSDRTEVTGVDGGPIQTDDLSLLTPVERAQRLAAVKVKLISG